MCTSEEKEPLWHSLPCTRVSASGRLAQGQDYLQPSPQCEYAFLVEFAELEKTNDVPARDLPYLANVPLAKGSGRAPRVVEVNRLCAPSDEQIVLCLRQNAKSLNECHSGHCRPYQVSRVVGRSVSNVRAEGLRVRFPVPAPLKTHSCVRRKGSRRLKRSSASFPKANFGDEDGQRVLQRHVQPLYGRHL